MKHQDFKVKRVVNLPHHLILSVLHKFIFLLSSSYLTFCPLGAAAQSRSNLLEAGLDPRGAPELTICSQNLKNFGSRAETLDRNSDMSNEDYDFKVQSLVKRFTSKNCDVIAVQELLGSSEERGLSNLDVLATALKGVTNRYYEGKVGPTNDPSSRVGFLIAKDAATVLNVTSYKDVDLPRLSEKQKPEFFTRAPLEIQLRTKGGTPKVINLVNFHFKSRRGAEKDATGLEFETLRMQSAEALRRILETRLSDSFQSGESLLVALGDRNDNFDLASAKILEGTLELNDFKGDGVCRLSKRGAPLCQAGHMKAQNLFSVLLGDPTTKLQPGTFHMKGVYSWLDDILLPMPSLRYAWRRYDSPGQYESGVVYSPTEASDHAMVYVTLNW